VSKIFVDQVDPKTATTLTLGTSGDTVSIPSGVTIANSGSATGFGDATSFRPNVNPIIINGNMELSQRGTSFTSNGYSLDRYTIDESTDGAITVTQDTDVPSGYGFGKSLKVDCTTADASIGAAQYCIFTSKLEGQNLQLLKYGTSNAENVTLSFWVKSVKTGTYCMSFVKEAGSGTRYECPIEYTISSASTWEKKVINLSPTAGSTSLITAANGAIVNSNASGFRIIWTLVSGSNFHATNNTWVAGSDKLATSNQVNFLDNTSNNFWITGVQMEVGEYTSATIPPFQFESYGDNLLRCQRYFTKDGDAINYAADGAMGNFSFWEDAEALGYRQFPVMMRAAPTMDTPTVSSGYRFHYASTVDDVSTAGIISTGSAFNCYIYKNGVSGTKGGAGHASIIGTGAYVSFSAEL
jgi:hypothetical protein